MPRAGTVKPDARLVSGAEDTVRPNAWPGKRRGRGVACPVREPVSSFSYFNSSPEVILLVVLMYVRFPLSLRSVEDLLVERGIDVCHGTFRLSRNRLGRCSQATSAASE